MPDAPHPGLAACCADLLSLAALQRRALELLLAGLPAPPWLLAAVARRWARVPDAPPVRWPTPRWKNGLPGRLIAILRERGPMDYEGLAAAAGADVHHVRTTVSRHRGRFAVERGTDHGRADALGRPPVVVRLREDGR